MKLKCFLLAVMSGCSVSLFAQSKTDTVKVWGNCDECKSKIEKAALKAGAASAYWNADNYQLVISYNNEQTSAMNIEKEIAAEYALLGISKPEACNLSDDELLAELLK